MFIDRYISDYQLKLIRAYLFVIERNYTQNFQVKIMN